MRVKNRYFVRSRISKNKFREIIRYFALDLNAAQMASLAGLNRNTVNAILKKVCSRMAEFCANESYFGSRRVRRKRGRRS